MWDMKILRIVIAAMLVLAVAALAGIGRPEAAGGASEEERSGITVTGVGTVDAVPDRAQLSLGVTTEAGSAREALAQNSTRMKQLVAALRAAGIAERDLQTEQVSVWPAYDAEGRTAQRYTASNSVSVVVREVDRAGEILEAASRAGANQINGPTLTREDRDGLEAKALAEAVENARKRAEALAGAAGVGVGRVTAITESAQPEFMWAAERAADSAAASTVPIEKGTQEITATVTVTFAIG